MDLKNNQLKNHIIIPLLFFSCFLWNCGKKERKVSLGENENLLFKLDSTRFCVFEYNSGYHWIFPENSIKCELTNEDLKIAEQLLNQEIKKFNEEGEIRSFYLKEKFPDRHLNERQFSIKLEEYRRQYIIATSPTGDRILHINLFCGTEGFEFWREEYVSVDDGGNCFFQVLINISKMKLLDLSVNGVA